MIMSHIEKNTEAFKMFLSYLNVSLSKTKNSLKNKFKNTIIF